MTVVSSDPRPIEEHVRPDEGLARPDERAFCQRMRVLVLLVRTWFSPRLVDPNLSTVGSFTRPVEAQARSAKAGLLPEKWHFLDLVQTSSD